MDLLNLASFAAAAAPRLLVLNVLDIVISEITQPLQSLSAYTMDAEGHGHLPRAH